MATIKRDAKEVALESVNGRLNGEIWDKIIDIHGGLIPWSLRENAEKSTGDCFETLYGSDPKFRYAVDQILDDAGVLMPSAEEVYRCWLESIGSATITYPLDAVYGDDFPVTEALKTNPVQLSTLTKVMRAIEAKEGGVDVDLDKVIAECKPVVKKDSRYTCCDHPQPMAGDKAEGSLLCYSEGCHTLICGACGYMNSTQYYYCDEHKPQSKTAQESTMSQTKTFRVKTEEGIFKFKTDGASLPYPVTITCECSVNNAQYSKDELNRIILALEKARDWKPTEDDIEDV